jgi:para-nitrobenzyl esterase
MQEFEATAPVATEYGLVRGQRGRDDQIARFKGLAFAAPPTGDRRWREPAPPQPWSGVRDADRFECAPLQPLIARNALMSQFSFADPPECNLGEDCLTLNIWTPGPDKGQAPLPVIVWLYGGGMRYGSASHPVSDGANLAKLGAVVVAVNYRLSGLGFLAHPALSAEAGVSGNYACHDILAALHWVRRNIEAFGGDSGCVTLFGQSAGAALVSVLMASPLSPGLFHRAIAHSGGRFGPMKTQATAEQEGAAFIYKNGANDIKSMRDLPGDATFGSRGLWGPIVDGEVLTSPVREVFAAGNQMNIPVLCGYTRDEAAAYGAADQQTSAAFIAHVQTAHRELAREILAHYPHATDSQARSASFALRRDSTFALQAWRLARAHRTSGAFTYLFCFSRKLPLSAHFNSLEQPPEGGFGAYHGSELWYAFNNLDKLRADWTQTDVDLARTMSQAWVAFARSGRPDTHGLEQWPEFDHDNPRLMNFGEELTVGAPFNLEGFRILDRTVQS